MKHHIIDATGKLQINIKARQWCRLPYPDHPDGCLNYGRREICPPKIKTIDKVFNLKMPHWLVAVEYNMVDHIEKMKTGHPGGSVRKLECISYWQKMAKKELNRTANEVCRLNAGTICNTCPEALGVDMIATGQKLGLPIQPKPGDTIFRIALVGYPNENLS